MLTPIDVQDCHFYDGNVHAHGTAKLLSTWISLS